MSLKKNIDMVKEELNSEEKFFEKAVITEKFVKKYKNMMIGAVILIIIVVVSNIVYNSNKQSTIKEANEILTKLSVDTNNENLKIKLEQLSPNLHDAWLYSQAIALNDIDKLKSLGASKAIFISDLANYEVASRSEDNDKLVKYSMNQDAIYKDLAFIQNAILYLDKNEIQKAHIELRKVSQSSSLKSVVLALLHFGVK
ncbi:MAG: hypothetical protein L3I99_01730 [Sulfurimonas sp.]|nr:hypothetical protein [Sulfurimonas sp.]